MMIDETTRNDPSILKFSGFVLYLILEKRYAIEKNKIIKALTPVETESKFWLLIKTFSVNTVRKNMDEKTKKNIFLVFNWIKGNK